MPRLGLADPRKPDGRVRSEHEKFLFVVRVAAFVVVTGVVAGFLLVSGGGGGDEVAVPDPAVPTIAGSDEAGETESAPPPPTETVAAPAVGTETGVIVPEPRPKPKPTARPQPTPRPPGREPGFAKIGRPCPEEGGFAFTRRFEPLVCRSGRWDRLF